MVTKGKAPVAPPAVEQTASPGIVKATADRFIAGKSAHALLALIANTGTVALPYALTPADVAGADVRRTARKAAAAAAAAPVAAA